MTALSAQPVLHSLLVTDDLVMTELVRSTLCEQGSSLDVRSSLDAQARERAGAADVIVLDLDLPGADSIEVCRQLRAVTSAYIVAIGTRDDSALGLVLSLSVGADDFIGKPLETVELAARVRAMLRRPRRLASTCAVLRFADLEIDTDLREARIAGRPVPLSSLEFDVLEALARNPRQTLSRRQLLDRVWGPNWLKDDHVIDVHISKLRRKLSDSAQTPKYIRTVRGFGFRMQTDPATSRVA